jgi:hypothetical protein
MDTHALPTAARPRLRLAGWLLALSPIGFAGVVAANHQIAEQLHLTPKTVRNYVSTILAKLQVHDRSQAIVKARDAGYPPSG